MFKVSFNIFFVKGSFQIFKTINIRKNILNHSHKLLISRMLSKKIENIAQIESRKRIDYCTV